MIEIRDLAFSYGNNLVLKGITTTLEEGKIYGLLGENGVGKTTLLTLLCGLKRVQAGTIRTDGENPFDRSASLLEKQYYLPDEVAPVNMKAGTFAKEQGIFRKGYDHGKFLKLMEEFETDPSWKMSHMSAGQLKKTYLSFALACNCKYLFLDEPTNGLDIPSKAQFRNAILKYTSEFDIFQTGYVPTTVFVDQNGHIIKMENGAETVIGSNTYEEWEAIIKNYL